MATTEIEIVVFVDSAGDYSVGKDYDAAAEAYDSDIGGADERRSITLKLTVPLPKPIEVAGVIPDTDGPVALTIG